MRCTTQTSVLFSPVSVRWCALCSAFNQKSLYTAYDKRTKNVQCNAEEYERAKQADPDFYRDGTSMHYGKVSDRSYPTKRASFCRVGGAFRVLKSFSACSSPRLFCVYSVLRASYQRLSCSQLFPTYPLPPPSTSPPVRRHPRGEHRPHGGGAAGPGAEAEGVQPAAKVPRGEGHRLHQRAQRALQPQDRARVREVHGGDQEQPGERNGAAGLVLLARGLPSLGNTLCVR